MAIFLFILLFAGFVSVKRLAGIEKSLFGGQFALIVVLFVGLCFDNKWVNIPLTVLIAALTFAGAFFWMADFKYLAHKFDDPEDNTPTPRQILVCPRMVAIAMVASYLSAGIVWLTEFGTMWSWISWILVVLAVVLFACAIRWAWEQNVWNKNHSAASGKELVSSVIWAILVAILICVSAIKVRAQLRNPFDFGEKRVTIGVVNPTPTPAPTATPVPTTATATPTPTPVPSLTEDDVSSFTDEQLIQSVISKFKSFEQYKDWTDSEVLDYLRTFKWTSTLPYRQEREMETGGIYDAYTYDVISVDEEVIKNAVYTAGLDAALREDGRVGKSEWAQEFYELYTSNDAQWYEKTLADDGKTSLHWLAIMIRYYCMLPTQYVGYYEKADVIVHWGLNPEMCTPERKTTQEDYPFWVYKMEDKDGKISYYGFNAADYRISLIRIPGPTPTPTQPPKKDTPTPTPTQPPKKDTPTPTPTQPPKKDTPTPTPTQPPKKDTPTPTPTQPPKKDTPTPTPTQPPKKDTPTPTPTQPPKKDTPTPTPTQPPKKDTPTPTPTQPPKKDTPTPTPTPSPTPSPTPTPTPTPSPTPTPTPTPSPTPTPVPKDPGQRPIKGPGDGGVVGTPTPTPAPEETPAPTPTPQPRPPRKAY